MSDIVRTRPSKARSGVATVEFAVCLPLITLLVFGTIESSSRIFLKQSLSVAAYESAREAIRSSSTTTTAKNRGENILDARQVKNARLRFRPANITNLARGTTITVEVSAPTNTNSPMLGSFIANKNITAKVVMVKE